MSLSHRSSESHAAGTGGRSIEARPSFHELTGVVLPKPAAAQTRLNGPCCTLRGRSTQSRGASGRLSLVDNRGETW
jgi:hypothetical protein